VISPGAMTYLTACIFRSLLARGDALEVRIPIKN
jgi:hypothetical protein